MLSLIALLILVIGVFLRINKKEMYQKLKANFKVTGTIAVIYIMLLLATGKFLGYSLPSDQVNDEFERKIQVINEQNKNIETKLAKGVDIKDLDSQKMMIQYIENVKEINFIEKDRENFNKLKWLLYFGE